MRRIPSAFSRIILEQAKCLGRADAFRASQKRLFGQKKGDGMDSSPVPYVCGMSPKLQEQLNDQIGTEFDASLTYLAMSAHFADARLALRGAARMFLANSREEAKHGEMLTRWLVTCGGSLCLGPRPAPVAWGPICEESTPTAWETLHCAVTAALDMERNVTESLLNVHIVARSVGDVTTADYISKVFLEEQVTAIYKLAHLQTQVLRVNGSPSALHLIDEMLYNEYKS